MSVSNPPANREEALFFFLACMIHGMGGSVTIPVSKMYELNPDVKIRREEFDDRVELHLEWPDE